VLYPQAKVSPFLPFNPKGCWDWWSYIDHDDGYVTKAGLQIAAIKAMLDALTAAGGSPPTPPPEQGGVPAELIVTDTSDTAAALAWTPVAGASSYRVWRAGADEVFRAVAETQVQAMAITGLHLPRPICGGSRRSSVAPRDRPHPAPAPRRGRRRPAAMRRGRVRKLLA